MKYLCVPLNHLLGWFKLMLACKFFCVKYRKKLINSNITSPPNVTTTTKKVISLCVLPLRCEAAVSGDIF